MHTGFPLVREEFCPLIGYFVGLWGLRVPWFPQAFLQPPHIHVKIKACEAPSRFWLFLGLPAELSTLGVALPFGAEYLLMASGLILWLLSASFFTFVDNAQVLLLFGTTSLYSRVVGRDFCPLFCWNIVENVLCTFFPFLSSLLGLVSAILWHPGLLAAETETAFTEKSRFTQRRSPSQESPHLVSGVGVQGPLLLSPSGDNSQESSYLQSIWGFVSVLSRSNFSF